MTRWSSAADSRGLTAAHRLAAAGAAVVVLEAAGGSAVGCGREPIEASAGRRAARRWTRPTSVCAGWPASWGCRWWRPGSAGVTTGRHPRGPGLPADRASPCPAPTAPYWTRSIGWAGRPTRRRPGIGDGVDGRSRRAAVRSRGCPDDDLGGGLDDAVAAHVPAGAGRQGRRPRRPPVGLGVPVRRGGGESRRCARCEAGRPCPAGIAGGRGAAVPGPRRPAHGGRPDGAGGAGRGGSAAARARPHPRPSATAGRRRLRGRREVADRARPPAARGRLDLGRHRLGGRLCLSQGRANVGQLRRRSPPPGCLRSPTTERWRLSVRCLQLLLGVRATPSPESCTLAVT